jgi:lipopolysaccharide exporter
MGAGWIIAWRMVSRNLGLVSTLILVRLLLPSDFGLIALASGFINSVDALSAIGVQDALVRAPEPDRDMYDAGFSLSILRGVMTALVVAAIAWPVGDFFADQRLTVVMLALSVGTLLGAFENIGIVDFRRDLVFGKEFNLNFWPRIIGVVVTVSTAAIWHSYWALVTGLLFARMVRLPLTYWMSSYRPHFGLRAWRKIIGFSLWTWALSMLYQVRERSDSMVIGRLLGATQVGVFSVGAELGSLPTTELVEPLNRVLFSSFASLHNAAEGLESMFLGAVGLGFLLILPAGIGISMVADPMVRLTLGEHWVTAVPVVQIMAVGGTAAIFTLSCGTLLNAVGRPGTVFYLAIVPTLVKVIALLALVPYFGLPGAAVALLLSALVDLVLFLWATLPRIGVSLLQLAERMVRPAIATVVMVAVLWRLDMAWTPSTAPDVIGLWKDAGARSAVGGASYGIVLLATWFTAGRPDGAERFALRIANDIWKRVRRRG